MFAARLLDASDTVTAHLQAALAALPDQPVSHAMAYACRGGKGLRGFLVLESARLHDLDPDRASNAAAAVEAMHAYSLIHDDLPCMDDDDMRRGRPTVHREWDEATAVLAGDALQCLAFDFLSRDDGHSDAAVRLSLVASMARAAGAEGMVHGQALDIAAESAPAALDLDQIVLLQKNKTGALIEWAATAGAVLAGADPTPLRHYAMALGLAFQIADDLLDAEGDPATAGKRLQKDAAAGKATFVSLLGVAGARAQAAELVAQAEAALAPFGARAGTLRDAARFVIERDS